MTSILLGVMGHVDHGKTTLVRALTGTDTDRLPEEKRRGISIALGFAHLQLDGVDVDFIDMPGHERFVRTMVSGATGIDAVLLVVAANEGIRPQTLEHLHIAALLGIEQALIVLTKVELASAEQSTVLGEAVAALVDRSGLTSSAPISISSLNQDKAPGSETGLAELRRQIAELARRKRRRGDDGFPYLPVDRAFTMPGFGVIVTGTLRRGSLQMGDDLVLSPSQRAVRVRGMQVHGRAVETAEPGQRLAVNLRNIEADQISRGEALTRTALLSPSSWLTAELRAVSDAPPLRNRQQLNLLFGSEETPCRLRLLDRDKLGPGDIALAQLHCATPVAVPGRERFILRSLSPPETLAGGVILEPEATRHRRHDPPTLTRLASLCSAAPGGLIAGELASGGLAGVDLARLARLAGLAPERLGEHVVPLDVVRTGTRIIGRACFDELCASLLGHLAGQADRQPNGMAPHRLAALAPEAPSEVVDFALERLIEQGRLRRHGAAVQLAPSQGETETRARQNQEIAAQLTELFRRGSLTPPNPQAITSMAPGRRAVEQLVREGVLVKAIDRVQGREVLFHRDAIETAKARLAPLLPPPGVLVSDAGAALGVSRKFAIPLLEYLDGLRFTRRVGDRRVLGPSGQLC